jgi:hypothetical protein
MRWKGKDAGEMEGDDAGDGAVEELNFALLRKT